MRRFTVVVALVALAGAALVSGTPARAAGGPNANVAAPLLRVGGAVATGQGVVAVSAKGTRASVAFSVAKLPADVAAPLGVFVETGVGAGTFTQAASIDALKHGAGKVALVSASGPPAALGVSDVADLVGRSVVVRRGDGTALLAATFPALSKFEGTKVSTKFGPSSGSALPKLSAALSGTPSPKTGSERFLLKVKGLAPGVVYTLFMEDAIGSGAFVAVGDLDHGQFLRDQAKGDSLPFGAATLADLVGRAVEVRDPTGPVGRGTFPFAFFGLVWPQHYVFLIDEPGTLDKYLGYSVGIVVYRSQVDLTSISIRDLVAAGESDWRIDPIAVVPEGLVCKVHLASDGRYWWQAGTTIDPLDGAQHYLGIYNNTSPPPFDEAKFILRFDARVGGHRTARIESFKNRGEFLADEGHGLAANGIRFRPLGLAIRFILR